MTRASSSLPRRRMDSETWYAASAVVDLLAVPVEVPAEVEDQQLLHAADDHVMEHPLRDIDQDDVRPRIVGQVGDRQLIALTSSVGVPTM
jgi:hypothetical protein